VSSIYLPQQSRTTVPNRLRDQAPWAGLVRRSGAPLYAIQRLSNAEPSVAAMHLDLSDLELETAARACRALAYQEDQAAKRMENADLRNAIENTAKRAAALAERFEAARNGVKFRSA
jgi:hypothetical protein